MLVLLVVIGGLLLATFLELKRRAASQSEGSTISNIERAIGDAPATTETESDTQQVPSTTGSWDEGTEAAEEASTSWDSPYAPDEAATPAPEETPEWDPHVAVRSSEDAEGSEIDAGMQQAPIAASVEDAWTEPTPTAMSEAAVFDEPDLTTAQEETEEEEEAPAVLVAEEAPLPGEGIEGELAAGSPETSATETYDAAREGMLEQVSAGVAAELGIPEEEPFERAGRWWFKRGTELLVYNEQTGEWMPSPTPLPEPDATAPVGFGTYDDTSMAETGVSSALSDLSDVIQEPEPEPEPEPVQLQPAQQGFWKCPACSAVNGSTATTCRMCFAERPAP